MACVDKCALRVFRGQSCRVTFDKDKLWVLYVYIHISTNLHPERIIKDWTNVSLFSKPSFKVHMYMCYLKKRFALVFCLHVCAFHGILLLRLFKTVLTKVLNFSMKRMIFSLVSQFHWFCSRLKGYPNTCINSYSFLQNFTCVL